MKGSPCLECDLKDEDKNNSSCRRCSARIRYVRGLENRAEYTHAYPGDAAPVVHLVG